MRRVLPALLAGLMALFLYGCDKKSEPEQAAAKGQQAPQAMSLAADSVLAVGTKEIVPSFAHPGVIEAIQAADIHPEVSAKLLASHFLAGDLVEKGDLLIELDPSEYQASVEVVEAELQSAEANALQAETNWERAENLLPKGYISAQDFDQAKANLGIARAAVSRAKAQLEKAKLELSHTTIKAPFSGRISKPRYAVGDFVSPAGKPIFQLVQLDPIYAASSVALSNYNKFVMLRTEMEKNGTDIPKLELTLELVGGETYTEKGTFQNWSHSSSQSSGMIKGRALFPNPTGLLLPGQNVTLKGHSLDKVERVIVPQAAVLQDQQGHYVMIVDDENKVQRKNLEMGLRDGPDWAVREGLEEGTLVITRGAEALRAGTLVSVGKD